MRKNSHREMAIALDDLLNDGRLERLFSNDGRPCALQLWILQIESEHSIENRIVYGRLLPYSHSSDCWSATDDDDFHTFGHVKAQVIRLNLYIKSDCCMGLLQRLCAGQSVSAISEELRFGLSGPLKARLGVAALTAHNLVYRPVAYLLNRDAHDRRSPSSPHGAAGAFSASITQTDKGALFRPHQDYNAALTAYVVKHLNADTGLDFGGADTVRFGDLELLVFPALDDMERCLLSVDWTDAPRALIARFSPDQVPHFNSFQFRLSIANDGKIVYSNIALAERDGNNAFVCRFEVGSQLRSIIDSTELEIFGFHGDNISQGFLCCRWQAGYIREINFQGHVVGGGASQVKFDWLEKTIRPSASVRAKAALTINRGNLGFGSQIGGREADPWVPANRDLASLFKRLHPPQSEGQFFLRWGQDDGDGRLQFVEWFKALLAKYQQHQIVIFDPYFDGSGLGLLLLCAAQKADYIVFRSLPKPVQEGKSLRRKSDKLGQEGINNLMANCEQGRHLLQRIKLRIYGLKEGRLHDRYILVMGPDKLPVAGFNLSNSFQKAAENYPLLVTPIPADVLLKVEQYKSGLVREAEAIMPGSEVNNPNMRLLFDSTMSPTAPRRYEPLLFLEKTHAGNVLSVWTGEPSLHGLSGDQLKDQMVTLRLFKDDSIALHNSAGLRNCLHHLGGNFADFKETWEILGDVLAHSRTEDRQYREIKSESGFLDFLTGFLQESFIRANNSADKEFAVLEARYFRDPVEALLYSPSRVDHLFHPTKYAALTWPEYFAIKFLWWYSPDTLLAMFETQAAAMPMDSQGSDVVRISLLSQIASEISLSIQFDISDSQRDRLARSSNGLLQWMGLSAIERQLEKPGGLVATLSLVNAFNYPERVRALGWMVNHAARDPNKAEIYKGLVAALHGAMPPTVTAEELKRLVDSMRGHMRQLAWAEPWLFQDVVCPLLQNDRANTDDACEIWMKELAQMLEPPARGKSRLFNLTREGQTTNVTAFLFAYSGPERQRLSLNSMFAILKRQRQIVQQPLASTSDWTRWDGALTVSLWTLTFSRWAEYYLRQRDMTDRGLEKLSSDAQKLAMVRPIVEWRSEGTSRSVPLAEFLDQVESLLAASDDFVDEPR